MATEGTVYDQGKGGTGMTLEEMKKRRAELGFTYARLSAVSGVPLPTVQKIFSGKTRSPRYTTLAALEKVLGQGLAADRRRNADSHGEMAYLPDAQAEVAGNPAVVKESPAEYHTKHQGEYTTDDWFHLPEDAHAELIDGVIYYLSEPTTIHQVITGELYVRLRDCISQHGLEYVPLLAPCGVQLDHDNKTMVEPDVFVICDRSRLLRTHVPGAPDLVIEVLSPGTRSRDMGLKCEKYRKAGVREYWMVDPDKEKVIVYLFEGEEDINIYGFDAKIPIGIFSGHCEIDFHTVHQYLEQLYPTDGNASETQ